MLCTTRRSDLTYYDFSERLSFSYAHPSHCQRPTTLLQSPSAFAMRTLARDSETFFCIRFQLLTIHNTHLPHCRLYKKECSADFCLPLAASVLQQQKLQHAQPHSLSNVCKSVRRGKHAQEKSWPLNERTALHCGHHGEHLKCIRRF